MFKELFESGFNKGQVYDVISYDENFKEMSRTKATYQSVGKGRQSPNKGKDVYVFIDEAGNRLAVGFWEIKSKFVKVT